MAEKDFVVKNGLIVNTSLIFANGDIARVGINNTSPDASLTVTGTANVSGNVTLSSNLTIVGTVVPGRILVGNTTINATQNSSLLQVSNSTATANLTAVDLKIGTTTVNTTAVSVGVSQLSSDRISVGNSTTNAFMGNNGVNTVLLTVANSTIEVDITPASITIGNSVVNSTVNSTAFNGTSNNSTNFAGQAASYYANAENLTIGTLLNARLSAQVVNTSGSFTFSGNTTLAGTNTSISSNVNVTGSFLNVASSFLANSTGAYHTGTINAASYTVGANIIANSTGITFAGNTTKPTIAISNSGSIAIGNSTTNTTAISISLANDSTSASISPAGFTGNGFNLTVAAANITSGTIASARISGAYTGITSVGTLSTLTSGNVSLGSSLLQVNSSAGNINTVSIGTANVNVDSGVLFVDSINNRVGINNTGPDAALTVTGSANVSGDLRVQGNFFITGTTTQTGTTEYTGSLTPTSNNINLGNASQLWILYANTGYFNSNVNFGANLLINSAAVVWTGNSTTSPTITIANSGNVTIGSSTTTQTLARLNISNTAGSVNITTVNVSVSNSTTSANITAAGFFGNGSALTSLNADNLTTGTLAYARIPANIVNTTGSFTLSGNTVLGGTGTALSSNIILGGASVLISSEASNINVVANTTGFNSTTNTISVSDANIRMQLNDRVYYAVPSGNTPIAPLTGNTYYFVSFVNSSAVAFSTTAGGANIDISDSRTTNPGESHNIKFDTSVVYNSASTTSVFSVNASTLSHSGRINAASHTVGANIVANSTGIVFVGNSTTSPTITLANTGSYTVGNSTTTQTTALISLANSVGSANITAAGFFGNGASLTSLNADNITSGTLAYARIPANIVNTSSSFTLSSATLGGANTTVSSNLNVTGTFLNVASAFVVNSIGAYHTGLINAASHNSGAIGTGAGGTSQNTTTVFLGNNTINTVITSAGLNVNAVTIANSSGVYTTTVNAASHTVGANLVVNSTSISYIGNTTTSPTITLANTGSFTIGSGTTTQTTSIISLANSAGSANVTPAGFFGNGASLTSLNATNITSGTLDYARIPANIVNTTAAFTRTGITTFSANIVLGSSGVSANGGFGTAGQVLHSNGTATYWAADDNSGGTVTSVASGNGITGGTITSSGTLFVVQGTGIVVNATGVHVNSTYIGTLTANNSNNLNGQAASFYANAENLTTGVLPTARLSGAYTGINQVGTLSFFSATGNANFDSGALFVDGLNNRVGINNTSPSVSLQITATDAIFVPIGNTAQRPSGANGMLRFNTDTSNFEGFSNSAWANIVSTSSGGYYKGNNGAIGATDSRNNLYRINSNTQSNNITIIAGENALTVGPMTIADGFNLTIDTGGRAVIV